MRTNFFVVLIVIGIASYAVISISTTSEQQASSVSDFGEIFG